MLAAVLDRVDVDGVEWIRVQLGSDRSGDFAVVAWAPFEADIEQRPGTVHLEPVYEYVEPDCPDGEPTLADLAGMVPLLALHCFGSRTLTFAPVQARDEGSERSVLVDGTPEWLAEGGELMMHWLPDRRELASLQIQIDPASAIVLDEHVWAEVTGRFDHPAAQQCAWESEHPEFAAATEREAVHICRGRFVVTAARRLTEAEIPPAPVVPTPGAAPAATVPVQIRIIDAPISDRVGASAVWTGSEMIVWGGWLWDRRDGLADARAGGAAYNPATGTWREITTGPLSARATHLAVWTGAEMLLWGGYRDVYAVDREIAAYDPVTDRWRVLTESPIDWTHRTDSVWTGSEWIIASYSREDSLRVIGYSPAADAWRHLPAPPTDADEFGMAWTGSEVLLVADRLYRIDPAGGDWSAEAVDFHSPVVWADDALIGAKPTELSREPFESDFVWHPVAWDPRTSELVDLPLPPESVYGPIWTGRHLLFVEDRLALDLQTREWLRLRFNEPDGVAIDDRAGAAIVWAEDRLIAWGGWWACPGYSPRYEAGYELLPAWPESEGLAARPGWTAFAPEPVMPNLPRASSGSGTTVAAC